MDNGRVNFQSLTGAQRVAYASLRALPGVTHAQALEGARLVPEGISQDEFARAIIADQRARSPAVAAADAKRRRRALKLAQKTGSTLA